MAQKQVITHAPGHRLASRVGITDDRSMRSKPVTVVVARPEDGLSLGDFLCRRLRVSGKAAKQLLDDRVVFVNDTRTWMARHTLGVGDRVEVQASPPSPAREVKPALLHENNAYMIFSKPPGLLTNGPQSLETWLKERTGNPNLLAVHRLDRETSGCVIFAKSEEARDAMIPLFESREVAKTYRAIVLGRVPHGLRSVREAIDGQPAVTHIKVIRAGKEASYLELRPETGRTHQIRRHMAAVRHPLLGDKQYANVALADPKLKAIARHMLHASGLAFRDPQNQEMIIVKAALPGDFLGCLSKLGLDART